MDAEQARKLREPFPPAAIGQLPKPVKADSPKGRCTECGGWHGLPAVHLDYVGHAATTDRLLQVDPEWTWEPMVVGPNGEPLIVNGGLWIRLTVCGVTRPGWGDGKNVKEMIGDAIRNASMRFGVALDLWAKEDLHAQEHESAAPVALTPRASPFVPPASMKQTKRISQLVGMLQAANPKVTKTAIAKSVNRDHLVTSDEKGEHASAAWADLSDAEAFDLIGKLSRRLAAASTIRGRSHE